MVTTHYPPSHIGGDAVFVQYLSNELIRLGHEVHIVHNPIAYLALRGKPKNTRDQVNGPEPVRHPHRSIFGRFDLATSLAFGFSNRAERLLLETVDDVKPDVIHWHNTKAFFGRIPEISGPKSLYTAHDYFAVCPRSNLIRPGGLMCENPRYCQICLLRGGKLPQLWRVGQRRTSVHPFNTGILCPSEFMARRLGRENIRVDGVLRNFVPRPQLSFRKKRNDPRKILYLGLLEPHKGVRRLIEAFSLTRENQGFELVIVGRGSLEERLGEQIEKSSLHNRVRLAGFISRSDIDLLLSEADAMVVPSEWPENAPLVALEALSFGVPIIGSDAGGIPEIVASDADSMLFRAGSSQDLARCILAAWNRGNADIGETSRRSYEKDFSPDAHLSMYFRFIAERV